MARSFWKGRYSAKVFISPSYKVKRRSHSNGNAEAAALTTKTIEPFEVYRRNHMVTVENLPIMSDMDFKTYNGYNFFVKEVYGPKGGETWGWNWGALFSTREQKVTHKVKISKAQRKAQQVSKRISTGGGKSKKTKKLSVKKKK